MSKNVIDNQITIKMVHSFPKESVRKILRSHIPRITNIHFLQSFV